MDVLQQHRKFVAAEAAEGKVNINEAGVEQLALLPRVGPAVARLARPLDASVGWYVSRVYFTSSISPGRQVLSNHASVGL